MPSRRFALSANSGSPASSVPAGQMYLQNAGAPTPSRHQKYTGKRSTKITATAYFSRLSFCVKAFLRSLGEGILYNKSCASPKGHSQPQMTRPKQSANKSRNPTT